MRRNEWNTWERTDVESPNRKLEWGTGIIETQTKRQQLRRIWEWNVKDENEEIFWNDGLRRIEKWKQLWNEPARYGRNLPRSKTIERIARSWNDKSSKEWTKIWEKHSFGLLSENDEENTTKNNWNTTEKWRMKGWSKEWINSNRTWRRHMTDEIHTYVTDERIRDLREKKEELQ